VRANVAVRLLLFEDGVPFIGVRLADRAVDDDSAEKRFAAALNGGERHPAAERMPDDDRPPALAGAGGFNDREEIVDGQVHRIGGPPVAVAHAGHIVSDDAIAIGEKRREWTPPIAMCAAAMNEDEAAAAAFAPGRIADLRPGDIDGALFRRRGDRRVE